MGRLLVAAFAVLATTLPLAAATNCGSGEFWYENKSCCVKQGTPQAPPSPPSGKACPASGNWYWSSEKSCCLPSSKPPSGNPAPTCPSTHSWSYGDSVCNPNTPRSPSTPSSSDCSSSEFWYSPKGCCLPHGGVPNPPSPPSGSECPTSGWYWGKDQGCCVPHHPPANNPPPQCPGGWDWISNTWKCQPSPPSHPTQPPSTPSGTHKKSRKARAASLCPTGLNACPIANVSGLSSDYECIDTTQELESCGGCLSTGAGQDCTAIKGAWNVGCEQGSCAVYNCMTGYKLSSSGKSCIAA